MVLCPWILLPESKMDFKVLKKEDVYVGGLGLFGSVKPLGYMSVMLFSLHSSTLYHLQNLINL